MGSNKEVIDQKIKKMYELQEIAKIGGGRSRIDSQHAKGKLTARERIEAHLTIIFTSLAIIRLVEKRTGKSVQKVLWLLDQVKEVLVEDKVSRERISKYSEIDNQETKNLLKLVKFNWGT